NFDASTTSGLVAGNSTDNATANYVYLPFLDFDTVTVELVSGGTGTSGEVFIKYNMDQSKITFDMTNVVSNGHPWQVEASPDDNGGTQVFLADVCVAAGTRILTAKGEVPVETLAEGDSVMTVVGDELIARPIRWVGRRRIDLNAHPRPTTVSPIRIRRDAFAQSVPHRDLLVSPDHGILVGRQLICARQLVNGTTIQQEMGHAVIEYFHVELDSHAILLAEGLTAESYLDTGNRGFF